MEMTLVGMYAETSPSWVSMIGSAVIGSFCLFHTDTVAFPDIHKCPDVFSAYLLDDTADCREGDLLSIREKHMVSHQGGYTCNRFT
jgi:hypothetical protein